ncbi:MAG TPA: dockerin type I domain-containing protein, partial [Longimicrobiaceae bacterium]|nr:dockerin type I domain-containing protein [Longimicrobiaceae bacterium]
MRFLPRLALLCGALLFLFGASVRPAAAQSGAIGIRGDVTADGNLTASDALAVLSHVVGKPLPAGYSAELDGDADGNGQVTALDALVILGRVVGKDVARYPVGRRLLSGVVGTAGGSVVSRLDSIRVEFPDGALAEAVNITVEPAANLPATAGLVPGSALEMGPDGQRFGKPVRLTLRYSPAAVPQGVDPEALRIHRRVGDGWEEVPGGTVDVKTATVSALLSGFSTYAVLPRAETGLALVKVAGDNQTGT